MSISRRQRFASTLSHEHCSLTVYFELRNAKLIEGVLHASLGPHIVEIHTLALEDIEQQRRAYTIVKDWVVRDRRNRRFRGLGV